MLACAAVAGCGGPIKSDELDRGVGTLESLAAEGALLADGVAQDRTRATYTRVQARVLADLADHEAEKLADAESTGALTTSRRAAITLSVDISDALGQLRTHPGDEPVGVSASKRLRLLARRATVLQDSI